jgi:hypothetical protein
VRKTRCPKRLKAPPGKSYCSRCHTYKAIQEFCRNRQTPTGIAYRCKACARFLNNKYYNQSGFLRYRARAYGILSQAYEQLLITQGGLCAICAQPETRIWKGTKVKLSVDHDHKTGQVRGLLCNQCNGMLGRFRDDVQILSRAINYLEKYKS